MRSPAVGDTVQFVQMHHGRESYAFYAVTRVAGDRVYVRSIGGLVYCDAVHRSDGELWYAIDDKRARY